VAPLGGLVVQPYLVVVREGTATVTKTIITVILVFLLVVVVVDHVQLTIVVVEMVPLVRLF
jgi:hypothetical protein